MLHSAKTNLDANLKASVTHWAAITAFVDATAGMILFTTPIGGTKKELIQLLIFSQTIVFVMSLHPLCSENI